MPADLLPRTVYLPADAIAEADRRAAEKTINVGTLLRLIALGLEPPLLQAERG